MIFSGLFKKHKQRKEAIVTDVLHFNTADDINSSSGIDTKSNIQEIDDELVAVITAAIQSSLSYDPQSRLVIKSIIRTGQTAPIWNKTGRLERINKKF